MATVWDRTREAFEEGRKATERVVESLGGAGEATKARVEKARLERALFKRFAELGSRVYEQSSTASGAQLLDDARIQELLAEVRALDDQVKELRNQPASG